MKMVLSGVCGTVALVALSARAETPVDAGQFQRGEQPVYGQKFYPDRPLGNPDDRQGGTFLELNPVRLLDRGLEFEFETRISEKATIGGDILYTQHEYASGDVTGDTSYWAVAPKVRFYPMEYLSGVFVGFKLSVGQLSWKVDSESAVNGESVSREEKDLIYAPMVHVGYRFLSWGKFTFAGYLGGGVNLGVPDFTEKLSARRKAALKSDAADDDWDSVSNALKNEFDLFRPDFGFTIGVMLN
jgi:hypothetical protein